MAATQTPMQIYVTALKNAHAMCAEAHTVYGQQAGHAADYPAIAERLQHQAQLVSGQMQRLDQALTAMGEKPSGFKDAVTSTIGAVAELGHGTTGDKVLKDYFVAGSFAGLSHIAFRSLKTSAELAGKAQDNAGADQAIAECEDFGRWLYDNVDQLTRDYAQRVGRGGEASPT